MVIALSGMVVNPLAYLSELLSKTSEMDGYNWTAMSNFMNRDFLLHLMELNHCMTLEVFLHWLALVIAVMSCTILSRYAFALRPISLFDGLISLHGRLRVKLSPL